MHFVDVKGILSAQNGILCRSDDCFAYLREFLEKYEQMSLF